MTQNARKEIIQLNGLTILVVMTLVANFLVAGFFYRWHNYQLFVESKKHDREYTVLLKQEHDLKIEIVRREGVAGWNATQYMRELGTAKNPLQ